MNWLNLFLLQLSLIVVYLIGTCIYNIFFHPLRHAPGPRLAKLSKAWSRYGNLKGRKSHRIHEAHLKYGNVVRVAPNELSFADPVAVRDIYMNGDVFVKEDSFYRAKRVFHEEMLMSFRDPEAHRQRKKLLQRGFSQTSMLAFEPQIDVKIEALLDQWASRAAAGPVNVYPWLVWLAFDIVYHLMFDEDPESVKNGEAHWVMQYMRAWRPTFIYVSLHNIWTLGCCRGKLLMYLQKEFLPQLETWGVYVPGPIGDCFRSVERWKNFASNLIHSCRTRETKTPFLNTASNGVDGFLGRPLTDSELAEESMGGMFGGSGTTANTLVYMLWGTLRQPELVKELRRELQNAFPNGAKKIPDSVTCSNLPLLQAVINETLRLYPTIIATLPRMAMKDAVVADMPIPAGTIVGTQNYTIHRNETAFSDSESFRPGRWLESQDEDMMKGSFTPFGVGPRSCIGTSLAKMELSKMTAAFFLRFDASVNEQMTEQEMEMYDVFSASPVGGKLLLDLRELA